MPSYDVGIFTLIVFNEILEADVVAFLAFHTADVELHAVDVGLSTLICVLNAKFSVQRGKFGVYLTKL